MRIFYFILVLSILVGSHGATEEFLRGSQVLNLNTSNEGKFKEFERLFSQYGVALNATHLDLAEIDAEPLLVVVHKASQLAEDTLVEDTSLEIEGSAVGVNIRWLLDHLNQYEGRKAEWLVLLAVRKQGEVYVYRGSVKGTIVKPKGSKGFGFDPVFLPDGAEATLAESKPDQFNARAKAVEAYMKGEVFRKEPVLKNWEGPWQKKES